VIRQLNLVLVAISFIDASGCVSHRTVLNDPISTLNRWNKLDATPLGTAIMVHLKAGVIISSSFQGSTTSQLIVTTEGANGMNIAKSDVLEITAADADSLKNGAFWGLEIGALGALGGGASQRGGAAASAFVQALSFGLLLDWLH
jgi:hypothetical protein